MTWYARLVLRSAWIQVQQAALFRFTFIISLIQPFFITAVAFYTLRHRPDIEATYVAIGVSLSAVFSVMLFSGASALTRERFFGTLELLEASPAPLMAVFSGRMMGSIGVSLISMTFSYIVVMAAFQIPVTIHNPTAFAVSMFLALISMWSMGMLFGPLSIFWPPVESFLQGLEYPVYILCGFLFPVLLLPIWLHPLSYALPPYWAAYAVHGSGLVTLSFPQLLRAWLLLLVTSALMLGLAIVLFKLFMARARRRGTLGYVWCGLSSSRPITATRACSFGAGLGFIFPANYPALRANCLFQPHWNFRRKPVTRVLPHRQYPGNRQLERFHRRSGHFIRKEYWHPGLPYRQPG